MSPEKRDPATRKKGAHSDLAKSVTKLFPPPADIFL